MRAGLVVGSVTTSEYLVLYVFGVLTIVRTAQQRLTIQDNHIQASNNKSHISKSDVT
ncbi:hypothetical protein BDP55DRAFT_653916 [Colletotrichum godetiae]|uniref:Uncharacterized protein n=1 Tax=Colletotrichum godetiae TaxID=1209918 RepID=A0AAJ0ARG9_9PEZI|nr:uncharacterized protein BDP55DRAFT_653916 [Colletotrichum godetiae]KAK1689028.1 hypothetical protein BDP55DRAFT_653916 [Colletotrichum godetiae]